MVNWSVFALTLSLVMSLGSAPWAAPITLAFSGRIVFIDDPAGALDPAITTNSLFSGSYTVDPDRYVEPPFNPIPNVRVYPLEPGGGRIEVVIAGVPFELLEVPSLTVAEGVPNLGDTWSLNVPFEPVGVIVPAILFNDFVGAKLSSLDFFVNQELTGWTGAYLQLAKLFGEEIGSQLLASGTIESLHVVPEPTVTWLAAAGLLLLAIRRASD